MNGIVDVIPLDRLAITLLPALFVLWVMFRWSLGAPTAIYAIVRMLIQLLLIGYFLSYIFAAESSGIIVTVLAIMLLAAAWIALRPLRARQASLLRKSLLSIAVGGGSTLFVVTQLVLRLEPWFQAQAMIPLAGMIFANSMNTVSLAAERYQSETERQQHYEAARRTALQAALIPMINSLFAVGLVSLPGMMTGQILSGVSPLIAARYQILVMLMLFAAPGLSAICYLRLLKPSVSSG